MKPSDAQIEEMRSRAHGLLDGWNQTCRHPQHNHDCDDISRELATIAIEAAAKGAKEERETCAAIADEYRLGHAAARIRARGTPRPPSP